MPLTTFKLEYKPCMKPKQTSTHPQNQHPYLLEIDSGSCTEDQFLSSHLTFDPRYENTGFMINLYELQDESQVFDDMEYMPGFNR